MNSKTSDQIPDGVTRAGEADGSLGEQLRRAREARGVSLREISEQTRITMRHLEAIETDDYKNLPGGIFNRSFVKAYARYINFNEQKALDLYARTAREYGEQADEATTSPRRSRIYTGDPARSPFVTAGLSAIIVGILILVVYAGLHYYRRTESQAGAPAQPTPVATPAAAQPTPAPSPQQAQAAADRLSVAINATREVWLRVLLDGETAKDKQGAIWRAGQAEEFAAQERVTLNYARSMAGAFEVTVNGTRLRTPDDTKPGVSQEWVITKENFTQYVQ